MMVEQKDSNGTESITKSIIEGPSETDKNCTAHTKEHKVPERANTTPVGQKYGAQSSSLDYRNAAQDLIAARERQVERLNQGLAKLSQELDSYKEVSSDLLDAIGMQSVDVDLKKQVDQFFSFLKETFELGTNVCKELSLAWDYGITLLEHVFEQTESLILLFEALRPEGGANPDEALKSFAAVNNSLSEFNRLLSKMRSEPVEPPVPACSTTALQE